ncbi:hypothetical protein ATU3B_13855 [Agrobacterium genomosp. 3 str. CIP 111-78]|jgi:hypothetical protein|uniref:Uncharacterized protein n=1 Tax=Agrobacterium tumefaciens TaxID=358 RepID=A0AAE6ENH4_AGRTU|nr:MULTISPECIES: hypothetical protein [Rhizobiaceae]KNY31774.1 hypothetical protein AKG12_22510 [Agrobacterium sp. SUL3]MCA2372706.1 hypothetical protein [Agrobacterium tomkonis CIP 111-78]PZP57736.1 MAG: hypothetical protein DI604_34335 [Delftia acidovorans]QCM03695.1 hypothetical protein CFBP6624_26320 [Agrobacterium tumefaciens]
MEKILLAAAIATITGFVSSAYAAPVPCEDMLKELRTATSASTLNAADAKAVADLEAKGVERCNADDDKRADVFFADAMKLLGK